MMQIFILFLLSFFFALTACERPYNPETVFDGPQLVVEGYVENGPDALPPYVILTRSYDYTASLSSDALNALFVHNAEVYVSDGQNEVQLQEICLSDLAGMDSVLAQTFAQSIGLGPNANASGLNPCVYIDVAAFLGNSPLRIETGRSYTLRIETQEGERATAVTTLTQPVPLDSVYYRNHSDYPQNDSLVEVLAQFSDPAGQANYYRLFSQRNSEPRYPASSFAVGSVTDDKIFEGQSFTFPVQRGQSPSSEFDLATAGFFWRGDTVRLRGSTLDYAHFRFWQTSDYSSGSQGPFGTYVRIQSNIEGGLGIWGGLSYNDYEMIIPR